MKPADIWSSTGALLSFLINSVTPATIMYIFKNSPVIKEGFHLLVPTWPKVELSELHMPISEIITHCVSENRRGRSQGFIWGTSLKMNEIGDVRCHDWLESFAEIVCCKMLGSVPSIVWRKVRQAFGIWRCQLEPSLWYKLKEAQSKRMEPRSSLLAK